MFSVHKTKIPTEYREKDIGVNKYFKCINFLIDCQSNTFLFDEYDRERI